MAAGGEMQSVDRTTTGSAVQRLGFLRALLDAVPSSLFVVDDDVRIHQLNQPASHLLPENFELGLHGRLGDVLHCIHAKEDPEGCGRSTACLDCVVRTSVGRAISGGQMVRERAKLELEDGGNVRPVHLLVMASPFEHEGQRFVMLLLDDIGDLIELKAMVPICSYCKKIRNDQQYWQKLEAYFKTHLDVDFTHGICPECADKLERDIEPSSHA
jgi:PAS domain-containing protein